MSDRVRLCTARWSLVALSPVLLVAALLFPQAAFATISVDQFVANTMGQQLSNAAGTYPGECVSLVSQYLLQVNAINNTGWNANAIDYQAGGNGGNQLAANGFTWSTDQSFANGDILVWGESAAAGTSALGHVGLWYAGKVYDQNDARHAPARTAGYSTFWAGGYLGHWRRGTATPRYNPIAPGDAGFTKGGTAAGWYSIGGGIYGTGLYTYGSNTGRDDWARWTFDLTQLNGTAFYKVEAYVTSTHAGNAAADYHINASDGIQHKVVNQNVYSNQWVDLGTYALGAGAAWVELDDQTTIPWSDTLADQICVDGMQLTYVGPVTPPNRAPVAVAESYTVAQGAPLNVATPGVLSNDTDADGNALSASLATNVTHGTLALNADGSFTYTPAEGYSGPDSFTYHANDGAADSNTVTVSITVTPRAILASHTSLTIRSDRTTSTRGHSIVFSGKISPASVASGTRITIWMRKSGHDWAKWGTAYTNGSDNWSFTVYNGTRAHGTYYIRVKYAGNSTYLSSYSAYKTVYIK